ncbi:triose-phosphate isomerase [Candidatus Saccharibacteria bacterium]|nr:triose-phosphate isomerase [Candidatus Saccharibacteria bacterium]
MMKTYIIGNWKMNFTVGEASLFLHKLLQKVHAYRDIEVVVAPSLVALQSLSLQVDRRKIKLACQNFCHHDFGAYTGEVSISQLRTLVDYAIVGHSERRYIFGETDKDIRAKVAAAIRGGLTPILCVGETESERTFGETADVIRDQVLGGLSEVSAEDLSKVIIAYEPVWAISGHGKPTRLASPLDVADVFALIRSILGETYGKKLASNIPLLFGGSVKSTNAESYLLLKDCNGLLIGGASLIAPEFTDIIEIAKRVQDERA